ncbi:TonB-dependent siderophore receptor [Neisseriaceae bacterium JH1-16]|nr:TonB-dependent siderophore receptor [Neisseriaceae bacterium JH1-16]
MQFQFKPIASVVAAVFAVAPVVHAEEAALPTVTVSATSKPIENRDYQSVATTVGKTLTEIRDIPQTVNVVNKAVMEAQGATSLTDALRNVPGITIGAAESGQIGNNINLRGFSARTDIYLDGMRDRGQYYRDTFFVESVDVLKGPSSMLFGRGSTGGVINQVSKKAELTPLREVSATIGTDGRVRSTLDINQPMSDTSALRVSAFGQDLKTADRDVMSSKDYGVAPSLRFGIGTPTEITLSALVQHNNDMPDYGFLPVNGHPSNVPRNKYYGLTDDRTIQDVTALGAKVEHKFSPNLTLRNQTQYNHYTTDARETSGGTIVTAGGVTLNRTLGNPTTLPSSQLFVQLASHDRYIEDSSLFNQTDLIAKFDTGPVKHTVLAGVEVGHDSYSNQGYTRSGLPKVSLLDPAYLSTPATVTTVPGNKAESSANTLGVYANDTLELTREWKVVAGLRWDRFDAKINNTTSAPASASQNVTFTSVRSGLIYQPSDSQSYYLSYGTSFDPSLEALTVTNGTQNLDPEKNRSYELGAKWDLLDGGLSLNSALFQVEKTNARTLDAATGLYQLAGDIRVNGAEVGAVGHLTKAWQIMAGYTYLDATIVKAKDGTQGNTPANTPRNTATLWSTYNLTPSWEVGGGLLYMSERYASNADAVSVGGYTRLDATVAYHQLKYDIRVNVLNLANRKYYDALIPSDGGRAVPAAGRTALVTGTYRF